MVEWGRDRNGDLCPRSMMKGTHTEPCVVLAEEDSIVVVPFVDLVRDEKYAVIGVRHIDPPLDTIPGKSYIEAASELIQEVP